MKKRIIAYAVIIFSAIYFYNSDAKTTPDLNCSVDGTYALTYKGFQKMERSSIPFDSFTVNGMTGKLQAKVIRDGIVKKADNLSVLVQQRLNDGNPMKFVYYRELPHWFSEGKDPWKVAIDTPKELQPIDGIEHIEVLTINYEGYDKAYSFTYHDSDALTHFGKCHQKHSN